MNLMEELDVLYISHQKGFITEKQYNEFRAIIIQESLRKLLSKYGYTIDKIKKTDGGGAE